MNINRREFIGLQAAMAGMIACPAPVAASTGIGRVGALRQVRHQSPPNIIPRIGLKVRGRLPDGLRGDFFKTGPAVPRGYRRSPAHLFDGDGFVQNYRLGDDGITFAGRFVETEKFRAEQARGDLFYDSFSTIWADSPKGLMADNINPANTSMRKIGDSLWALWEAGSPYEIDPENLETVGRASLGESYRHAPFSAHPHKDPAGGWWNFGQIFWQDQLLIYQLDGSGRIISHGIINDVQAGMIHDFAVTERFLVFIVPPLVWQQDSAMPQASFLDSHAWRPELGTSILVIDKQDMSVVRRHQVDPGFQFHFANAFDDANGDVYVDFCRYDNPDILFTYLRMDAEEGPLDDFARPYLTRLHLKGSGTSHEPVPLSSLPMEFPKLMGDLQGPDRHTCLTLGMDDRSGFMRYVALLDVETGGTQLFDLGPDSHADEHSLVRSVDGKDWWIIGTHSNLANKKTYFDIFTADDLSGGPMTRAEMPLMLPPALHGDFVPA